MFELVNDNTRKQEERPCSSIDLPSCWICDAGAYDNDGCLLCDSGSQNDIID